MKKGQQYVGVVERIDFPNKGIVSVEGESQEVVVKNALPGQTVSFVVSKTRGGRIEGRLLGVVHAAPCEEAQRACPNAGVCGGCLYQGFPYEETLRVKEAQILKLLSPYVSPARSGTLPIGAVAADMDAPTDMDAHTDVDAPTGVDAPTDGDARTGTDAPTGAGAGAGAHTAVYDGIQPSPKAEGYRNKMEYTFGDSYMDGPLALGLHRRGSSYDICDASVCRIADGDFGQIVAYTRAFFAERGIAHYHRVRHDGILRHLLLRRSETTGELLIALVTTSALRRDDAGVKMGADRGNVQDGRGLLSDWLDGLLRLQPDAPADASHDGRSDVAARPTDRSAATDAAAGCCTRSAATDASAGCCTRSVATDLTAGHSTQSAATDADQGAKVETGPSQNLCGRIAGVLHIINDSYADAVLCQHMETMYGQPGIAEELLGLTFEITPFSFFQTNTRGAERLYSLAREYLMEAGVGGTVYDLYSGTGTIAQMMSTAAERVIGVEIVEEAVAAARENARRNGIHNCTFLSGDVLQVLDKLGGGTPGQDEHRPGDGEGQTEREEHRPGNGEEQTEQDAETACDLSPDCIILDPPRDGIHPKALPKILSYGVPHILYISCKPTSLARDLEHFYAAGYHIVRYGFVDMFPMTGHVETICLLSKLSSAKHHIEINVDMDELDLTSAEAKATYEEIRNWVQEKYGLHVTNLNIAQVKQKHGIIERENYNKPKSPDSKQPGCPQEKVKAIEDAMRHFQMI